MNILVVSGFLGAGKTTFIKELIHQTSELLVVMENELGETNLDSQEISAVGETEVYEFMEGCVCCTMKEDFAASVLTIANTLNPNYLIVEPSGVARLGDLLSNVGKICYERIQLLPSVAIVVPSSFWANMLEYKDIFTDQLTHASTIVFSKLEHASTELVQQVAEYIASINPSARIVSSPYEEQPDWWWSALLCQQAGDMRWLPSDTRKQAEDVCSQIETAHQQAEGTYQYDGDTHQHAGDTRHANAETHTHISIEQYSFKNARLLTEADLLLFLEELLRGRFGSIVRAKGVVCAGGQHLRFDVADFMYCVTQGDVSAEGQCVFIGRDINRELLSAQFL